MLAKFATALLAISLPLRVLGQPVPIVSSIGNSPVLAINSADIPAVLDVIHTKIEAIGFAAKWQPGTVITQDVVVAEEIVFTGGGKIVIAPKSMNELNAIFFIAKRIRVVGAAGAATSLEWVTDNAGQLRDPIPLPKAANGLPGIREGENGKNGSPGITGNKGYRGQDAPSLIFVANVFDISGPIVFSLRGQDGGSGGAGQEGGDGGPGKPGRPGLLNPNIIGLNTSRACQPAIRGGNGGDGGAGGAGGVGGRAGDGGSVVIVGPSVNLDAIKRFVHRDSTLASGGDGSNGKGGRGGAQGKGAPRIAGEGGCSESPAGDDGKPGRSADDEVKQEVADQNSLRRTSGFDGSFGFATLTPSQAKSIGLR